ncbi:hypothetical protein HPB51_013818 [Rhipicephalus microplus]|uniref:Glucosylceramidase n=1 Tax=Rhipicephalus microplus TaxID=6941 RepID=A0A9J6F2Z4_RHIMP|nr:hypothetical protein HPB51_013818 [Rhipicephalus microplus]
MRRVKEELFAGLVRSPPNMVAEFLSEAVTMEKMLQHRSTLYERQGNTSTARVLTTIGSNTECLRDLIRSIVYARSCKRLPHHHYLRFVQEYERHGVPIWGLTTQNEPTTGFVPGFRWQTLGFSAKSQRDFVKLDLGPALAEAGYGVDKLQLMILDDSRLVLPHWANVVLGDPDAAKYVGGVAVHWYTDNITDPHVLDEVHDSFPNKFILGTEACTGSEKLEEKVLLGSWERAELYAADILQDFNHWVSGWTDWNLALDTEGGPNWVSNFVDSPIIVNASAQEFYKQPMYYALAHFSKALPRGTVRIDSQLQQPSPEPVTNSNSTKLEYAAFKTPDSSLVVIVLNRKRLSAGTVYCRSLRAEGARRKGHRSRELVGKWVWGNHAASAVPDLSRTRKTWLEAGHPPSRLTARRWTGEVFRRRSDVRTVDKKGLCVAALARNTGTLAERF